LSLTQSDPIRDPSADPRVDPAHSEPWALHGCTSELISGK